MIIRALFDLPNSDAPLGRAGPAAMSTGSGQRANQATETEDLHELHREIDKMKANGIGHREPNSASLSQGD